MNSLSVARQQFLRFIVVGLISTAVSYGVFLGLFSLAYIHYQIASAAGFIAGVFVGFPLNKAWTYSKKDQTSTRQKIAYGLVYLGSLALSLVFLYLAVDCVGLDARIANVLSIGLTTCTNYIGTKFFVFKA